MLTIFQTLLYKKIYFLILFLTFHSILNQQVFASSMPTLKIQNVRQKNGKVIVDLIVINNLNISIFLDKNEFCPIEEEFSSSFKVFLIGAKNKKIEAERIGLIIENNNIDLIEVKSKKIFTCVVRLDDKNYLENSKAIEILFDSFYILNSKDINTSDKLIKLSASPVLFVLKQPIANKDKTSKILDHIENLKLPDYKRKN